MATLSKNTQTNMQANTPDTAMEPKHLARVAGACLLGSIALGVITAMVIAPGIDVNLTADIEGTAVSMQDAELRLRAKAYAGLFNFGLESMFLASLFLLLRDRSHLLAMTSLLIGFAGSALVLSGSVYGMNAAEIASNEAFVSLANDSQRIVFTALQATADYTSFHLSLVLSSAAKAGFFWLLLTSALLPKPIAAWGVFASVFVVVTLVLRDFIPIFGHDSVTIAFMASNLIALLALGAYLCFRGVRETP